MKCKMVKLAELRKSKGLTQQEFAEKIGISNKSLSRYERGDRNPSLAELKRIADVLGCEINDLI